MTDADRLRRLQRVRAARRAQGLPPKVRDGATLDQIATLVLTAGTDTKTTTSMNTKAATVAPAPAAAREGSPSAPDTD